jgi:DNA-binding NtrC family response regulator
MAYFQGFLASPISMLYSGGSPVAKEYIICVDDDKTILMSLRAQLRRLLGDSFQYEIAESAHEGWEIIEDIVEEGDRLAVVISDWQMPEVKGDQFLVDVHEKYPETIKIMLTGQVDEKALNRTVKEASLAACFTKPWDISELIETIKKNNSIK